MPNIETSSGSLGSRVGKYSGGVEVPSSERAWTAKLVESFRGLDPAYQRRITGIISDLQKEDPEHAKKVAHRISDFFRGVGDSGEKLSDLLAELENRNKLTIH